MDFEDLGNLDADIDYQDKFIDGKTLLIPDFLLREFFYIISKRI